MKNDQRERGMDNVIKKYVLKRREAYIKNISNLNWFFFIASDCSGLIKQVNTIEMCLEMRFSLFFFFLLYFILFFFLFPFVSMLNSLDNEECMLEYQCLRKFE